MSITHVDELKRDPSRPLVMGILNVTPDSFASSPLVTDNKVDVKQALENAQLMWDLGADLIDVGGESTRPNSERVTEQEELDRVLPIVIELTKRGIATSIDTMRSSTAREAVGAGTVLINDVSGGLADPAMLSSAAELKVPYVAMHWRRHSDDMYSAANYDDVVTDVINELQTRKQACIDAGINEDLLILDPGIGFSKLANHNWELLQRIDELAVLGSPLLIGVSRKRFFNEVLGERPTDQRDNATAAVSAVLTTKGAWGFRVHDVASTMDAVKVTGRLMRNE